MPKKRNIWSWYHDGGCIRTHGLYTDKYGRPTVKRYGICQSVARHLLSRRYKNRIIPSGIVTRHTCDNAWCVSPNHIISGSQKENIHDSIIRGRKQKTWESFSYLDKETVIQIRKDTRTSVAIAKELNVPDYVVRFARIGRTWKHI